MYFTVDDLPFQLSPSLMVSGDDRRMGYKLRRVSYLDKCGVRNLLRWCEGADQLTADR